MATNVVTAKNVDLDNVLDQFRLCKRYHVERIILGFLVYLFNAMYCMNYVFAAEEISYSCKDDLEGKSQCNPSNTTQRCSEWVYEKPDSFFAYFDLACQEWKRTLVGTVHSVGFMFGLLLIGPISDRFGRKPLSVITGVLGAVLGMSRSFSSWYWFYLSTEFLEGAIGDNTSPIFILLMEIISKRKRLVAIMFVSFGTATGSVVLSAVAWLTPDWRWFLRAIYLPGFVFCAYKCLLDESPRWLLTKGRKVEAVAILENAAQKNQLDIDKKYLDNLTSEADEKIPLNVLLKETFQSRKLRNRFIICVIWWMTSTFVNYGLLINSVSLQGNVYLNYMLVSIVDAPGSVIVTYLMINFKRRTPLMLSFFIGAILCVSEPFLPTNIPWLSIVFFMAGKLMCCIFFHITYIYTAELFPTYTRNSIQALCSSVGRVGSIVAPQTPLLMVYWSGLPSFVFGLAALIAGLTTFFVPDITENDELPDTVYQAEALGTRKTS